MIHVLPLCFPQGKLWSCHTRAYVRVDRDAEKARMSSVSYITCVLCAQRAVRSGYSCDKMMSTEISFDL